MKKDTKKIGISLKFKVLTLLLIAFGLSTPLIAKKQDKFVIIIDAGHGGRSVGSVSAQTKAFEKQITLEIAKELEKQLKGRINNSDVKLTRKNDEMVTLKQRVDMAKKMKGNLFISLHTNFSANPEDEGFKAYVLAKEGDDDGMAQAIRENSAIGNEPDKKPYGDFNPSRDNFTGFEMPDQLTDHYSNKFAEITKQKMAANGFKSLGVSSGPFWTLSQVGMPGAVLELGFISNAADSKYLMSKEGQKKIAQSLANAIVEYVGYYRNTDPKKISFEEAPVITGDFDEASSVKLSAVQDTEELQHDPNTRNDKKLTHRRRRRAKVINRNENRNVDVETVIDDNSDYEDDETFPTIGESTTGESATVKEEPKKPAGKVQESPRQSRSENTGHRAKKQKVSKEYAVLIYTSKKLLDSDDVAFKGLTPDYIHENNEYKYICGKSENRKDVEALLSEIKKRIPGAKIIEIKK